MYSVNGVKYYVHQNHLFSVAAVTDAAGSTRERYSYTSYGDRAVRTTVGAPLIKSQVHNGIGFTGYVINSETSLLHARARQYDPMLGRFIGRDPWRSGVPRGGYADGWNLYMSYFVPNSVDPTGMVIPIIAGGAAAGAALEAAAAAAGLTVAACLATPACRDAATQAMQDAINASLDAAAKAAAAAACASLHSAYKFQEIFCEGCNPGRANFCLRPFRCMHAMQNAACWAKVAGMRQAYISSGCDFILGNNFAGHLDQLQGTVNAMNRCLQSMRNNCK
jgi:RHS repeat-associated protein